MDTLIKMYTLMCATFVYDYVLIKKKINPVQIYCSTDFNFDAGEGGRGSELAEFLS